MSEDRYYSYIPAQGHGLAHDPFNAIIAPRPIGWISSVSASGAINLAPYSFFNAFNYTPPVIGFSSTGWKDTVSNISETREFVWNLTTRDLVEAMNDTAVMAGADVNEFALAGLESVPGEKVAVPRVARSPVQFECRLTQMIQLQDAQGATVPTWLTLGEVVAVHIRRDLLRDGVYDMAAAAPVLRAGGAGDYVLVERAAMFELLRPQSVSDVTARHAGPADGPQPPG